MIKNREWKGEGCNEQKKSGRDVKLYKGKVGIVHLNLKKNKH